MATEARPSPRLDLPRPETADAVEVASLLGEPVRSGILAILRDGPHCVCEMAAALDERQNNVSNHLARLRDAGLVRASRHGGDARWVYYERDEDAVAAASEALARIL
jgi:ArsR family transcriptional regulator